MTWYLKGSFRDMPTFGVGRISAGGSDWGYVLGGGGEPLVYPAPEATCLSRSRNGHLIQSSAHNSWYVNKGINLAPAYATWSFKPFTVIFNDDKTISQCEYPDMKLCLKGIQDGTWMSWVSETYPYFNNIVLIFEWEEVV